MSEIMGVFGKIRQEAREEGFKQGFNQGRVEGARKIIIPFLEFYSIEELSPIINMSVFEIREILK